MTRVRKRQPVAERQVLTRAQLGWLLHGIGLNSFESVADAEAAWREHEAEVRAAAGTGLVPYAAVMFDGASGRFSHYEHLMEDAAWPPLLAVRSAAGSTPSRTRPKKS